ncbi:FadR/GntR family transcriptional regulator [Pseudonocardia sp. KRD291]|uniref:FadR/GntR family transcriptional regulator n=1 Tax=Pseudonocardia sp. KRD291 TaxID=2792007 RepID=UPI001C4A3EB8|nr:FCD domain-containing protein [Pseudonocardia sp. KRD291]MBW0102000.1 FadR family transcriptional regulator [Pseudonocardia sp. KRD291]
MSAGLEGLHRNVPLSTQLAEGMRDRIDSGDWPVGMRIPSESALVAELGVSRNSVREALRSLVHAGLLDARPGDGTYVRASSELRAVLERRARRGGPGDAAEVRSMLECQGARLASTRATPSELDTIGAALRERDHAADARAFAAADLAFHRAVVAASGNALLAELHENLEGLAEHIEAVSATPDFATFLARNRELNACHSDLLDAIAAGDPDRAESLAAQIVRRSHRTGAP